MEESTKYNSCVLTSNVRLRGLADMPAGSLLPEEKVHNRIRNLLRMANRQIMMPILDRDQPRFRRRDEPHDLLRILIWYRPVIRALFIGMSFQYVICICFQT